ASAGEVAWDASDPAANNGRIHLAKARIVSEGKTSADVFIDQATVVQFDFEVLQNNLNVCSSIHLMDKHGACVLASGTPSKVLGRGCYRHSCTFPANFLNDGRYTIAIILLTEATRFEIHIQDAI